MIKWIKQRLLVWVGDGVDRRVYEDALDIIQEQAAEIRRLEFVSRQRGKCLGFFASVIKSGENWTDTCETEFYNAMYPPEEEVV
jgi:hypothetical protein